MAGTMWLTTHRCVKMASIPTIRAASVGETVRREMRWTSSGATPARKLVRSTSAYAPGASVAPQQRASLKIWSAWSPIAHFLKTCGLPSSIEVAPLPAQGRTIRFVLPLPRTCRKDWPSRVVGVLANRLKCTSKLPVQITRRGLRDIALIASTIPNGLYS
jgi:hypothetical protein